MKAVKVGVGVIIEKQNQILLGQRINSHGAGAWSAPGGHLEFGETPEQCAARETQEETGLIISEFHQGIWTNNFFEQENQHYVTLFIYGKYQGGEPKVMEPNKCKTWQWCDWDRLPQPLFLPLQHLVATFRNKREVKA